MIKGKVFTEHGVLKDEEGQGEGWTTVYLSLHVELSIHKTLVNKTVDGLIWLVSAMPEKKVKA